jgi:DNA-binding CsgD family transcriptional regulator
MPDSDGQADLFPIPDPPDGVQVVNDRCLVRTQDGHRVVIVAGIVLVQYAVGDRLAEAHARVALVEQGWADQNDVARAFGCSARTVRREQARFEDGGLAALGQARGYPQGRPRITLAQSVERLKRDGHSNREIARRLGIHERAVRKRLYRAGWTDPKSDQERLPLEESAAAPPTPAEPLAETKCGPNLSAFCAEDDTPISFDHDPADRRVDRLMAYLGMLEDAAPLFRSETAVPRGGVLLAVAALLQTGVFECARDIYGSLAPAFYGLRTSLMTMLLMALLRIKRPEALKEHSPAALGRILGLDRAPEVKTLRRKLARLAAMGRAADFGRALAERRIAQRGQALGFLYVDGHVRVYHGKHTIPKAFVPQRRLAVAATTDYWVNDQRGDPLFVVTAEANAGMVKMLPVVLEQIRALIGKRRVTVVFDRGGFSPKLFVWLIEQGFDVLTYRKGRSPRVPRKRFRGHAGRLDGRRIAYVLADQEVRLLQGKLRLRQVTRLREHGHQTAVLTSRRDLPALEVAYRMFERWRQENFFKYLAEEYALDALAEHDALPDDPAREVPNPARKALDEPIRSARNELLRLQAEYGLGAFVQLEGETGAVTLRSLKKVQAPLARTVRSALQRFKDLQAKRATLPARVPVRQAVREETMRLAPERQHLMNLIKMVAYQAESDLVALIQPHYRRAAHEGRTLIQSALADTADLTVTDCELHVRLHPLSSPHRSRAIAALCDELNRSPAFFPGSSLRLHFSVATLPK